MDWLKERIQQLQNQNLYRTPRTLEFVDSTHARLKGRLLTLFCGNDYLGLSRHPKVINALIERARELGTGSGSARLISGTNKQHMALEEQVAAFLGKERALLFSSGYMANLGVIAALVEKNDFLAVDKLSHASIIDGCRLSGTKFRVYPHRNLEYLEKLLKSSKARRKWIVTDTLFSMDGDLAPLRGLVALKRKYGAHLIIDEAHATGVFGARGCGVSEHFGVRDQIDVHVGTCSKALGSVGGFAAAGGRVVDYLINRARPFIFDTALPACLCEAIGAALRVIQTEPERRENLWANIRLFRQALADNGSTILESEGPIAPVWIGGEKEALEISSALLREGFLVPPVRYPAVGRNQARLRITVSANHEKSELKALAGSFLSSASIDVHEERHSGD